MLCYEFLYLLLCLIIWSRSKISFTHCELNSSWKYSESDVQVTTSLIFFDKTSWQRNVATSCHVIVLTEIKGNRSSARMSERTRRSPYPKRWRFQATDFQRASNQQRKHYTTACGAGAKGKVLMVRGKRSIHSPSAGTVWEACWKRFVPRRRSMKMILIFLQNVMPFFQ